MANNPIQEIEEHLLPLESKQPFGGFDYFYYYKKNGIRYPRNGYVKNTQELISKIKKEELVGQLTTREVPQKRYTYKELNKELIEKLDNDLIEYLNNHKPLDYEGRRRRNHYLGEKEKYINSLPWYKKISLSIN